jgi:GcrA cell cycle regulator
MSENKSPPTPLRTDDLTIPVGQRKTIKTLQPGDCRWPFGDPLERDFHFCGKQKTEGNSYCDFHMRRAFQAARPRAVVYRPRAA